MVDDQFGDGGDHPLKVTSPRLEIDEVPLTAFGRREVLRPRSTWGRGYNNTKSSRAVHKKKVGLDDSEQVTLDGGSCD